MFLQIQGDVQRDGGNVLGLPGVGRERVALLGPSLHPLSGFGLFYVGLFVWVIVVFGCCCFLSNKGTDSMHAFVCV